MPKFLFCPLISLVSAASFAGSDKSRSDGFELITVEPGSVYEKMGLKEGDLLKTYSGEPFKSSSDVQQLLEKLFKKPGVLKLKIERKGKLEELTYNLK